MLDKDPKDISAGDILRTLEGDLTPIDCAAFSRRHIDLQQAQNSV